MLSRLVVISAAVMLSGCLQTESRPGEFAPDLETAASDWWFEGNGTAAWRVTLSATQSSPDCNLTMMIQGSSTGYEMVGFLTVVVPGETVGRTGFLPNDRSTVGTPRVQATTGGHVAQTQPMDFFDEWLLVSKSEFTIEGQVDVLLAFKNTEPTGLTPREPWESLPTEHGFFLHIACSEPIEAPVVAKGDVLLIADERTMPDGVASMHAGLSGGIRLAHVGAVQSVSAQAEQGVALYGYMSGDPSKVGLMTLDGPDGSHEWHFLPAPSGVAGDTRFGHVGPPGDYELHLSGVNVGPLIAWRAALLDVPGGERSAPESRRV